MSISEKLKSIAKLKQISMTEFALRLGFSRQNLYEKLGRGFLEEELNKYCEALGVTYEIVFRDAKTGKRL